MKKLTSFFFAASIAVSTVASIQACSSSSSNVVGIGSTTDSGTSQTDSGTNNGIDSGGGTDAGNQTGAITGLTAGTWSWVPFAGALCRDGSSTGIAVNLGTKTDKLMIFFEGGGACFNADTCSENPSTFGDSDFQTFEGAEGKAGIFSRSDANNSVKDWSYVYVPYCTGDVHAGNLPAATITGLAAPQVFDGYANVTAYLKRLSPTFKGLSQILLAGQSAGGFGAALNYDQVAGAFTGVPITLLDDSGPLMSNTYIQPCLEQGWRTVWGLDSTVVAACGADCPDTSNFAIEWMQHLAKKYPTAPLGLVDSTDDNTITVFYGFGAANCTTLDVMSGPTFTLGLEDIRSTMSTDPLFGAFIFDGTAHTSLVQDYQRVAPANGDGGADAGTILLEDWVTSLVAGTALNAGP